MNLKFTATVVLALFLNHPVTAIDEVDFGREVRTLLAKNCFACHGRDENAREADLRLDLREAAIDGGAIVAGNSGLSELVKRIESSDPDLKMPPPDTGHVLSPKEIETLKKWIDAGATYEQHWSFKLPQKVSLPIVKDKAWPINEIDFFILSRLESEGLKHAVAADRLQWLRRVSLDLTGLPPSLELAERFAKDQSDHAYETVVEDLLKSPAYGEHWARLWLDLARYADTKGYEKDRHRDIWRYRDWVIDALNQDMPYDQFTLEQLAGDMLSERTDSQILATAFHRNTMTNEEGGTDNEEFRVAAVKDRVDTTIQVWMGLTMGCAKCHTHKYDPISVSDYYSFYALFNQTQDNDTEGPHWPTPTLEQTTKLERFKTEIAKIQNANQQRSAKFKSAFTTWKSQFADESLWQPLKLVESKSEHGVTFAQSKNKIIVAEGNRPDKDNWTFIFDLPKKGPATSIRIDHFPKASGGGNWPDTNVALQELKIWIVDKEGSKSFAKLRNSRASFSQRGWEVQKAIDGQSNVGWAISPKFNQRQAAVFDFEKPVSGKRIEIRLEQNYGQSLLLARSRFSISSSRTEWNRPDIQTDLESLFASEVFPETKASLKKLATLRRELTALERSIPKTPVLLELDAKKLRTTKIHNRGNFLDQTIEVQPAILAQFGGLPNGSSLNRVGVAKWLMSPQNPLTARVMVNRIWARIFGIGIVETEEDFGTQGMPPSHAELLDWLAIDFREQGWSIKKLLKKIALSQTYRQTSQVDQVSMAKDPRNRLLSRGPRFRLSAEMIRDQSLAVSGLLTQKVGGPSVMPPQPGGIWKSTYSGEKWVNAVGPDRYRRGIYTYLKRTSPYPALQTFDAGSGEVCQVRRIRTNTPLQALVMLNDEAYFEAAGALAMQMEKSGKTIEEKLVHGFRRVLIRQPTSWEVERLIQLYQVADKNIEDKNRLLASAGLKKGNAKLVLVASVLLNLDETVTKP